MARASFTSRTGQSSYATELMSARRETRAGARTAIICAMPPPTSCPTTHA
jgi:hypothetical protein